ncbi:MAG: O-methyltransferase [Thermoplasmata archaeon]|nr:MAG: O-methyltransferase [Thermoplasmata archaeon]
MTSDFFGPDHFPQFLPEHDEFMHDLEIDALARDMRICGPAVGHMLHVMVKATGARRVLELGVSVGYSTIYMARALPEMGSIIAMEWDKDVAAEASGNFERTGLSDRIDLRVGDAREMMRDLPDGSVDFIFMDFEKEMYSEALPECVRLLRPGGTLFTDNVAFRSSGDFNRLLADHPDLDTSFVFGNFYKHSPDEDAVSISVKRMDG